MGLRFVSVIAVIAVFGLGCSKKDEGGTGSTASAVSPEAAEIFKQRCVTCHGDDGKGSGPAAASLNPKPRDYTDAAWQGQVKDDELRKIIVKGGAAVGKATTMPPNPDLESKPAVVDGLVAKIRSFKK
ncbi:MAG: cytochrome c [Deltaproteobacteria bacterium]|nr:cytochrome c [Deltaproteobacteria bacterium]